MADGEIVTLIEDGMPMAVVMPTDDGQDAEVADDDEIGRDTVSESAGRDS